MLRPLVHASLFTTAVLLATHIEFTGSSQAEAQHPRRVNPYRHPVVRQMRPRDLFSNYYVGPARQAGGVPVQLYTSPLPTPPLVGHTYITYEALMPHEFMYHHKRTYFRHNPGEGWTHTKVRYW